MYITMTRLLTKNRDELLSSFAENGIGAVLNAGSDLRSLERVPELAEKYDFLYGAAGLHPDEVVGLTPELWEKTEHAADRKKMVAIGEFGLDYYGEGKEDPKVRQNQEFWMRKHIELALDRKKPVLIHSRDAAEDTMRILKEYYGGGTTTHPGIVHCYSYSPEQAKIYVGMGFCIGVGGVITFKNARRLRETVAQTDMDHIVLETDCPYLAPEPFRGTRNTSLNLPYVVSAIAQVKGISEEEVISRTEKNAKEMFAV